MNASPISSRQPRRSDAVAGPVFTARRALLLGLALSLQLVAGTATAATTGTAFKPFYDFIYEAATGYLGRGIAITGGVIGLGTGAAMGRPLLAAIGIVLAIFGALGPTIADTIYNTAIV